MTDTEIMNHIIELRELKFPPSEFNFPVKKISGELGSMFRKIGFEKQNDYYQITENKFFALTSFDQYLRLKPYIGFKSSIYLGPDSPFKTNCNMYYNRLRGHRFHLMHGKTLIKGVKELYRNWYTLNEYPEEFYLLNLHSNLLSNLATNRCGTYHVMEDEIFDINQTYNTSKNQSKIHNQIYTMMWKKLIFERLKNADRKRFGKWIRESKLNIDFVKRHSKSIRTFIKEKIVFNKSISIVDTHILYALVYDLNFTEFVRIANTYPKNFKHATIKLYPFLRPEQIIKNNNQILNEKNKLKLTDNEIEDTEAFEDIWDDFWEEV